MKRHVLLSSTGMLSLLLAAAALPAQAEAEDKAPQDRDMILEEIHVTARSIEETLPLELSRYGSVVEIVTVDEIENAGLLDVTQALELLVPGATVTTQAGAFSYANISLQGSRNSDVLWTIDGVRIGNRLYNSTSPADTLPASLIERVEVLKGGQGLFYGTQAVAGVINVVTRPFSDETDGAVSVGVDSHEGYRLSGHARGAVGDHKFVVWGSQDKSDGYEIYDDYQPTVTDRKRGYDVKSLGIKYGYDFSQDLNLTLQYVNTHAALDYPSVAGNNINDRHEQIAIARLDYTPSEAVQLFLKTYYHQWDTDYWRPGEPSAYWGYKDFGVNAMTKLNLHKGLEYHIGYEFQNYRGKDDVLLIAGETEQVHALFGQVRTTDDFSERLRLAAGARHNKAGDADSTVWSVSGVYEFSDALYVEGSAGTSFLLPDAQQLYGVDPCCAKGNTALKPEESFSVNLGIGGRLHETQWLLTGWDRKIDNLITTDRSDPPEGFPGLFVNIDGEVKARGFEATLRGPLAGDVRYLVSYTYSEERARNTNTQIAGRPEHSGKASLSWSPAGPYGADLSAKYIGDTESNVSGFGVQSYGDYWVTNLGAHIFLDGDRRLRLGARLENLFDEGYATSVSSAVRAGSPTQERFLFRRLGAPRALHVNLTYNF